MLYIIPNPLKLPFSHVSAIPNFEINTLIKLFSAGITILHVLLLLVCCIESTCILNSLVCKSTQTKVKGRENNYILVIALMIV